MEEHELINDFIKEGVDVTDIARHEEDEEEVVVVVEEEVVVVEEEEESLGFK